MVRIRNRFVNATSTWLSGPPAATDADLRRTRVAFLSQIFDFISLSYLRVNVVATSGWLKMQDLENDGLNRRRVGQCKTKSHARIYANIILSNNKLIQ